MIFGYMKRSDVPIIFDIDGTLTSYNYGFSHCHLEPDRIDSLQNIYEKAKPIPTIQRFVQSHGASNIFCISKEPHGLEEEKASFVVRNYGIEQNHVFFAKTDDIKIQILSTMADKMFLPKPKLVYVDDNEEFLARVESEIPAVCTAHITIFFER